MNKKRALLIIIIFALIVLLALIIFYFFFKRESTPYQPTTPPGEVTFPIGPDLTGGPGGESGATSTAPYQYEYYNRPQTFQNERAKLRLISSLPVSGATLFKQNADVFIHYVERANGHIYETIASRDETPYRISKTTIPKIYQAYWVQQGQGVIIRYLKDDVVQTFYARIRPSASTSTEQDLVNGTFLPSGISELAVSPSGERIFYLVRSVGETLGIRSNPDGTQRTQIFSSTVNGWLPVWSGNNVLMLITKPSAGVPGYAYTVNASSGSMKKILGGISGLTLLPDNNATSLLYSESKTGGLSIKSLDTRKGIVSEVGITTLPEKCVWGIKRTTIVFCAVPDHISGDAYPDAWYQGVVSFTDNIWKINLETGEATIVLSPQSVAQKTMDITDLVLDESESYLLFTNKKDLSLWLLDLRENL